MAKTKHITRAKIKPPPQTRTKLAVRYADAALIRLCVIIQAELAAHHGCSSADPDGNNCHAEPIWAKHMANANRAIEQAAAIKATTWAGLASKAAAMRSILDDECGGLEDRSELFYRSFAVEAEALCKAAVEKERLAARDAEAAREAEARVRQAQS